MQGKLEGLQRLPARQSKTIPCVHLERLVMAPGRMLGSRAEERVTKIVKVVVRVLVIEGIIVIGQEVGLGMGSVVEEGRAEKVLEEGKRTEELQEVLLLG
jgi:hypothetical protein